MLRCGFPDPLDLALKSTIAWLLLEKQRAAWWINFIESSRLKNAYQEELVLSFLTVSPYKNKTALQMAQLYLGETCPIEVAC